MDFSPFNENYITRLIQGDPEVEKHFTGYFASLLLVKLRGSVRSPQLIEDVRQETFLRVLQALRKKEGLQQPERLGAFVNSVCNNVLLEKFREAGRDCPMPDNHPDPIDTSINLESELVTQERKEVVQRVLAELSAKDRELLSKVFLEERDKDEVCREMEVNSEYLRVLLHRARARFKAAMIRISAATF